MVPNKLDHVRSLKDRDPQAWKDAHTGNAHTEDFVRRLAAELHAEDPKWGLVGKRGNPSDIADDTLCYFGEGVGHDPTHGNTPITVVDFIRAAGSVDAAPVWQVFTDPIADAGPAAWVKPGPTTVPVPTPSPCTTLGREEALDELNRLDAYYKVPEGLQRPGGLSLNGRPDFLGIAAWYLDVYERERIVNKKSREDARAVYIAAIRHSDEWRQKHPGETP